MPLLLKGNNFVLCCAIPSSEMCHSNYEGLKKKRRGTLGVFCETNFDITPVFACDCFSNAQLFLRYQKYLIVLER